MKKQSAVVSRQSSAKTKSAPRVSVKVGSCSLFFSGLNMEMKCPCCGVMVRDGEQHECVNGKPVKSPMEDPVFRKAFNKVTATGHPK